MLHAAALHASGPPPATWLIWCSEVNTPCCRGLTGILSLPAVVLVKVVQLIVEEDRCSHAARRCERDVAERPIPIQLHSTGRDSRWNVI